MIGRVSHLKFVNNMKLQDVTLEEQDLDIFLMLSPSDKIGFVNDLHLQGTQAILKYLAIVSGAEEEEEYVVRTQYVMHGSDKICITQLGDELRINSDSLRAVRTFVSDLWSDGYILRQMSNVKTDWDNLRYLKVYRIVSYNSPLCEN
jgi:hypothetical protein